MNILISCFFFYCFAVFVGMMGGNFNQQGQQQVNCQTIFIDGKNFTDENIVYSQPTQGLGMQTPALLAQLRQQGNQYSHQSQQY